MSKRNRSFNPIRHWQETQAQLIAAGLLVLLVVGGGLVWVFYGRAAAFAAASCLLAAGAVFGLLWLILGVLERWANDDDA